MKSPLQISVAAPALEQPGVLPTRPQGGKVFDALLAGDLERLRHEEQIRIDREHQEALARAQQMARFD